MVGGNWWGCFPNILKQQAHNIGGRFSAYYLSTIHLILLAVNTVHTDISGSAHIYSNCLNAVNQVRNLPTDQIPAPVKQSNILKIIMIHCRSLRFTVSYSHVAAHQDDNHDYADLSRPAQLNCACDLADKMVLQDLNPQSTTSVTIKFGASMRVGKQRKNHY